MTRLPLSELGDSTADRVMGHRPEVLSAWDCLKHALVGASSTLSPELKEQVRRIIGPLATPDGIRCKLEGTC